MAIYTFSTRDKRPEDHELVAEAKEYCEERGITFSFFILQLLREWRKRNGR